MGLGVKACQFFDGSWPGKDSTMMAIEHDLGQVQLGFYLLETSGDVQQYYLRYLDMIE
jgi:hypothetical protein